MYQSNSVLNAEPTQFRALGIPNVRVVLIAVTVPEYQLGVLHGALHEVATKSDEIGTLEDGSLGILRFFPKGEDIGKELHDHFIPRLRLRLLERTNGREIGPVRIRVVDRDSAELSESSDLTDALLGDPDVEFDLMVRKSASTWFEPLFSDS